MQPDSHAVPELDGVAVCLGFRRKLADGNGFGGAQNVRSETDDRPEKCLNSRAAPQRRCSEYALGGIGKT